jgi:hypothetical protein
MHKVTCLIVLLLALVACGTPPEAAQPTPHIMGAPTPATVVPAAAAPTAAATAAPTEAPTATPEPTATSRPTNTPRPTVAPTAVPQPTEAPTAAPAVEAALSGGLGLAREAWEAAHGPGTKDVLGYVYEGGAYNVLFQDDPAGVSTVWNIEQRFPGSGVSLDDARAISAALLPSDRSLTKTYTPVDGRTVDLYRSEWLKGRFPATMKIGQSEYTMWTEGEPGDFITLYRNATGKVTSIIITIGNAP